MIRAETYELLLTLIFRVRQPFLELGDYLILGFEQQYPPVASCIIGDISKVLEAMTVGVEWPTCINVHKCKLLLLGRRLLVKFDTYESEIPRVNFCCTWCFMHRWRMCRSLLC